MIDRFLFAAVFEPEENGSGYTVTFPDLPGCITEGDSVDHAVSMAQAALKLHIFGMEKDGMVPEPTSPENIKAGPGCFVTLIEAWMPPFRKSMALRSVKKTLTIPKWLNDLAEHEGINFSYVLQKALRENLRENSPHYSELEDKL